MPYRGKKQMLFEALVSEPPQTISVPSRDSNNDDEVLFGIKWRTFYRYIKDYRKDGYAVRKVGDEYSIINPPDTVSEIDETYTVRLSYAQINMMLVMLKDYCGGFEKKDLKKDSLIRSIWEEIDASLHGNQDL